MAIKGQAYGIRSIRVDGNDALAVYLAVKTARKMAIEESRPILIEVISPLYILTSFDSMWSHLMDKYFRRSHIALDITQHQTIPQNIVV